MTRATGQPLQSVQSMIFVWVACLLLVVSPAVFGFSPLARLMNHNQLINSRRSSSGSSSSSSPSSSPSSQQPLVVLNAASLSGEEINSRLEAQLSKLRAKDRASKPIKPEDLKVIYADADIIVVDKPAGVLCVPSEKGVPSLAQTVFEYLQKNSATTSSADDDDDDLARSDQMVVHRLGMGTSGLVVFAKTMNAVRGMNALFRTRKITRQYEALVCGHVKKDQGLINLPIMRDYEHPPFMRISTDEHQAALVDLDAAVVGKKLLEAPKTSLTHYRVMARESLNDNEDLPVTRLSLTSITGRTHQLNVHCAAFGHPIVRDTVYGFDGDAAPNGGLDTASGLPEDGASEELQKAIAAAAASSGDMCVHAKLIKFRHPVTKEDMEFTSQAPF